MDTLWQDLRFALRLLRKAPGFTAIAVLSLTLGIGANTTIFTLAKAIFLQSVPVKDAARVVVFFSDQMSRKGPPQEYLPTPYPNAVDYLQNVKSFSGASIAVGWGFNLTFSGKHVQVPAQLVSGNFFDVLGVEPMLGRAFSAEEEASRRPVAVISYFLWKTQFGSDPGILGRSIQLDQMEYSVIGVAPQSFRQIGNLNSPDVWVPVSLADDVLTGQAKGFLHDRSFRMVNIVARLKPGVTLKQAQSEVHAISLQLQEEYPKVNSGRSETIVPISETSIPPQVHDTFALAGALMMGIVALVLLIACANVANLLLARAMQRQREIAVRLALGARRTRLIQQLLTESLLLALVSGGFGMACAYWAKSGLISFLPLGLVRRFDFSLDGRVFLYTLGLAVIATLLFGLVPALQASRKDSIAALKDRTGAPTGSTRWYGLRGVLVMIQVVLSLLALAGGGLFIHSLRNAEEINPGFEVKHDISMLLDPSAAHYAQPQAEALYRDVVQRLDALPMVAGASVSDAPPLGGGLAWTTFTDGVDQNDPRNGRLTPVVAISPGYFSTRSMTLLEGRDFNDADDAHGNMVAVVNTTAANTFWPGQDPIGKHLHFITTTWSVTVVGEVNTVKYASLGEAPQAVVYWPLKQHYADAVFLFVRSKGADPAKVMPSVGNVVHALAPGVPPLFVETVEQTLDESLTAPRMGAELLGIFGLLALILAAIGTYGVMSYSVTQRTNEIGIRMTLGAQPANVLALILSNGMAMVIAGVVVGLGLSVLLARSMHALLYGIGMFDAVSFLSTSGLLILVALGACWIPARRAMKVDPMVALRYE